MFVLLLAVTLAWATDVRDVANAWRVEYNRAVSQLDAGKPDEALASAKRALKAVPAEQRAVVLRLVAQAADEAGDRKAEFNALDELLTDPKAEWGLFWNGAIVARRDGYDASAYRYAQAAWQRTNDKPTVAPLATRAALTVGRLDEALVSAPSVDPVADGPTLMDLTTALIGKRRCDDARAVAARLTAAAYQATRDAAASCK